MLAYFISVIWIICTIVLGGHYMSHSPYSVTIPICVMSGIFGYALGVIIEKQ
jgi:hypothetical protein